MKRKTFILTSFLVCLFFFLGNFTYSQIFAQTCFDGSVIKQDTLFDSGGGSVSSSGNYTLSNSSIGQFVGGGFSSGSVSLFSGHCYKDEVLPECYVSIYPDPNDKLKLIVDWSNSKDKDSGTRWYEVEYCIKDGGVVDPHEFEDGDIPGCSWTSLKSACGGLNEPGQDPNRIIVSGPTASIPITEEDEEKSFYTRLRILDKTGNWSRPHLSGTNPNGGVCGSFEEIAPGQTICLGTDRYSPWCGNQRYFGGPWFQTTDSRIHTNSSLLESRVTVDNVLVSDSTDTDYESDLIFDPDLRGGFASCGTGGLINHSPGESSERGSFLGNWMAEDYGKIQAKNDEPYTYAWFMENFGENISTVDTTSLLTELQLQDCDSSHKNHCRYLYEGNLVLDEESESGHLNIRSAKAGRQAVIFVNGNLTIDQNFTNPGDFPEDCGVNGDGEGGSGVDCRTLFSPSLAFIVDGDIYVDHGVTNIYGLYFANKNIRDDWDEEGGEFLAEGSEDLQEKLWVFGTLGSGEDADQGFVFKRDIVGHNLSGPAEQIINMPKYFFELSSEELIGSYYYRWEEE